MNRELHVLIQKQNEELVLHRRIARTMADIYGTLDRIATALEAQANAAEKQVEVTKVQPLR